MREYRRKNWPRLREKNTKACLKWRHAHSEHRRKYMREYVRVWNAKNHEKIKEQSRNLYATDPKVRERYKIKSHKRRTNGIPFTTDDLNKLFEQQDGFCFYCGELLYSSFERDMHVDHKTPISRGGTNDLVNLALTCAKCNLRKHDKTEKEFLKEIELCVSQ